ncbi:inward rectifier potassium channel 2-like [Dendroctonus ponderosae]|uniref:inward rectifier potassium channel 2-like n=1 Tax=Dendroctonus ponderosae TaxID=77166 RepID=UPI002034D653|nr:inward rectifier potassium channel 2-like [Dendroctonus ponderosae]
MERAKAAWKICQRDGELCLIFRVRDYDMRYECHTNIVAYLAEERAGELSLRALKLEKPGILIWPVEVIHKIDESSPLWDLSAKDLILKRFEVIVVLEGECLVTSYMSRTTTSYLSREIKWGHMFSPCVRWDPVQRRYIVDHKRFNRSVEVGIPLCSAQRLDEVYEDLVYQRRPYSESGSSSKYTSPATHSPSINSPIYFRKSHDINELEELETVADVHRNPASDDEDSSAEEEGTFMDLSLEDLQRRELKSSSEPRPRTLSGTAKDFLASIQRYVKEGGGKTKSYEETAF